MPFPPAIFLWPKESEYHQRNILFSKVCICQKQAGGTANCKARSEKFCFQFPWIGDNIFYFVKGRKEGSFFFKNKNTESEAQQYFCEGELSENKKNDPFILLSEKPKYLHAFQKGIVFWEDS